MKLVRLFAICALMLGLANCSKFKDYRGPQVTHVVVNKGARELHLLHNNKVLKSYRIGLGFAPTGDKEFEGDGRTPEGAYVIDRRNPNSKFHLSIGISYPNNADRAAAKALGKDPGGDIFIHGRPRQYRKGGQDWTAGCIAVTDRQIQEIYAMVKNGTPITIRP